MDVRLDKYGYLSNFNEWNEDIAIALAAEDKLDLTPEHWEVLYFLRSFYQQHRQSPGVRVLVNALQQKYGKEKDSIYLYRLFPKGPAKQATLLAGLPKPAQCI